MTSTFAAFAFQPPTLRSPRTATRCRDDVRALLPILDALSSATSLPDILMHSPSSILPPEFGMFAERATTPMLAAERAALAAQRGHRFSDYLMNAVSAYILLSAVCTFAPIISKRLQRSGLGETEMLLARLSSVPKSEYGWLEADLRIPLPQKDELSMHPIGYRDGRKVFLCHGSVVLEFAIVEHSIEFSEHYNDMVFICQDRIGEGCRVE